MSSNIQEVKSESLSETDLIKAIVRSHFQTDQMQTQLQALSNQEVIEKKLALCKLYLKMWSAITKFIKNQCDKERLIEIKLLGSFFKATG